MAFFKSFQNNLPSVNISSILDSVSSRVDDLANAVSDVTYAVSDQLTEQVTTIISKVQEEEGDGQHAGTQEPNSIAAAQEGRSSSKSAGDGAEADYTPSQLEWEWRDGCWRVKKTEAELAAEERRKKEEAELRERREQRIKERRQKQLEKEAKSQQTKEEPQEGHPEDPGGEDGKGRENADGWEERECGQPPQPLDVENDSCWSKERIQNDEEGKEKEEVKETHPRGENDETETSKAKKKKSEKKKEKEGKKGSKKAKDPFDVEKKKGKEKIKEKKKKKKKDIRGQSVCCFRSKSGSLQIFIFLCATQDAAVFSSAVCTV